MWRVYRLCLRISEGVGKGERKRGLFMHVGGGGYGERERWGVYKWGCVILISIQAASFIRESPKPST